nr:AraC family transcriptional regulator [Rhizobium sp. Q54]
MRLSCFDADPGKNVTQPMPSVPLPFVISLLLCMILARTYRWGEFKVGLFPALIAGFALQAMLSGLNWNLGWAPARLLQPVLAALLPALCFTAFDQLRRNQPATIPFVLPHLIPAVLVLTLVVFWRGPIDVVLFATYLGYGLALLAISKDGPDVLSSVRIADGWSAYKALVAMAALLIATSIVDAIVSIDFLLGDGEHGRMVLNVASVSWLLIAGYAATVADTARPNYENPAPLDTSDSFSSVQKRSSDVSEDKAIADRIDVLMQEQKLYRDPDLTLERLARRMRIPARQISGALNRVHGRNVSQIVNNYRVAEAKQRLGTTRDSITMIMLDVGFGTKSNFNREFLRVTGTTPSHYRSVWRETSSTDLATDAPIH